MTGQEPRRAQRWPAHRARRPVAAVVPEPEPEGPGGFEITVGDVKIERIKAGSELADVPERDGETRIEEAEAAGAEGAPAEDGG